MLLAHYLLTQAQHKFCLGNMGRYFRCLIVFEVKRIKVRSAVHRDIHNLATQFLHEGRVLIFGIYDIESSLSKPQIQHKDFQLNKHGFAAAGGSDNHRIAVDKASAQPDDEIAGHGVSAVTNAARCENLLRIERYKCCQRFRQHRAHALDAAQTVGHGRVKGAFLLKIKFCESAVIVCRRGFQCIGFQREIFQCVSKVSDGEQAQKHLLVIFRHFFTDAGNDAILFLRPLRYGGSEVEIFHGFLIETDFLGIGFHLRIVNFFESILGFHRLNVD